MERDEEGESELKSTDVLFVTIKIYICDHKMIGYDAFIVGD